MLIRDLEVVLKTISLHADVYWPPTDHAGGAHPGVQADQGDSQQAGRVHRVQPARLHLRPQPQPPEQPPGGPRGYKATGAHAGAE